MKPLETVHIERQTSQPFAVLLTFHCLLLLLCFRTFAEDRSVPIERPHSTESDLDGFAVLKTLAEAQKQYIDSLGAYEFTMAETMTFENQSADGKPEFRKRTADSEVKVDGENLWVRRFEKTVIIDGKDAEVTIEKDFRLVRNKKYVMYWSTDLQVARMYEFRADNSWPKEAKWALVAAYPRGLDRFVFADSSGTLKDVCRRLEHTEVEEIEVQVNQLPLTSGSSAYIVKLIGQSNAPFEEFTVDPARGHSLVSVVHRNGDTKTREVTAELREYSSGKWFPWRYEVVQHAPRYGSPEIQYEKSRSNNLVTSARFNVIFNANQFTWGALGLTSGVRVMRTDPWNEMQLLDVLDNELVPYSMVGQIRSGRRNTEPVHK